MSQKLNSSLSRFKQITNFNELIIGRDYLIGKNKDSDDITSFLAGSNENDFVPTIEKYKGITQNKYRKPTYNFENVKTHSITSYNESDLMNENNKINIFEAQLPSNVVDNISAFLGGKNKKTKNKNKKIKNKNKNKRTKNKNKNKRTINVYV